MLTLRNPSYAIINITINIANSEELASVFHY